jgi:hypothetical protein
MRVDHIDHVQLAMPAGREHEVRAFYQDVLGIPEIAKPPHLAERGGCWFERGALKVHLGVSLHGRHRRLSEARKRSGRLLSSRPDWCRDIMQGGGGIRMPGMLERKSALITGGGGGIGRATALAFAREGARVAVADLAAEAAEETVALINQAGGQAMSLTGDITSADVVRATVAKVVATYGRLDCAFLPLHS